MITVMASGSFDVLHEGHSYYLGQAKKLGDKLIVVVATDKNYMKFRGKSPLSGEKERIAKVEGLGIADKVIVGHTGDIFKTLGEVNPDILAMGYDQKPSDAEVEMEIKKRGLRTKIARIPAYKPETFKSSMLKSQMPKRPMLNEKMHVKPGIKPEGKSSTDSTVNPTYPIALFPGRFQPFHNAHLADIEMILRECRSIAIAIGSSQEAGTENNPFSFEQRKEMIARSLRRKNISKYAVVPVPDIADDLEWVEHVKKCCRDSDISFDAVYTGNAYVEQLFSEKGIPVRSIRLIPNISATRIRALMKKDDGWKKLVPGEVASYVKELTKG